MQLFVSFAVEKLGKTTFQKSWAKSVATESIATESIATESIATESIATESVATTKAYTIEIIICIKKYTNYLHTLFLLQECNIYG